MEGAQAAISANEIQREMMKAGQWVHIDIAPTAKATAALDWLGDSLSMQFKSPVENVGVGPAINVIAKGQEINESFGGSSAEAIEELKGTCRAISGVFGRSIKHGEFREFPIDIRIEKDRAEAILKGRKKLPAFGIIFVACCVYYKTTYSKEGSARTFVFTIMKPKANAFGAPITPEDIPLSVDQLVIRRAVSEEASFTGEVSPKSYRRRARHCHSLARQSLQKTLALRLRHTPPNPPGRGSDSQGRMDQDGHGKGKGLINPFAATFFVQRVVDATLPERPS